MKIVMRAEARALGLTHYFTGKPCKHGHVNRRRVNDRTCLSCVWVTVRRWEAANPDKKRKLMRPIARRWKQANLARVQATERNHYAANLEAERERKRDAAQRRRDANPTLRIESRDRQRIRRITDPRRVRAIDVAAKHRRRARKRSAGGSFAAADIDQLVTLQRGRCAEPGCRKSIRKIRHIDHIVPLRRDGSNGPRNLQLLCPEHNLRKGAKDPIIFARQQGRLL